MKKFFTIFANLIALLSLAACANTQNFQPTSENTGLENESTFTESTLTEDIIQNNVFNDSIISEDFEIPEPRFIITEDTRIENKSIDMSNITTQEAYKMLKESKNKLVVENINFHSNIHFNFYGEFLYKINGQCLFNMINYSDYRNTCSPCHNLDIKINNDSFNAKYKLRGYNSATNIIDCTMDDQIETKLGSFEEYLTIEIIGDFVYTIY